MTLALLSECLSNRNQKVNINGVLSDNRPIHVGGPQGSIPVPLFYRLYTWFFWIFHWVFLSKLYSDDTSQLTRSKSINIQEARFNDWAVSKRLTFNYDETLYIIFGYRQIPDNGSENCVPTNDVSLKTYIIFVAVHLEIKLNFHGRISHVCNKVFRCMGLFRGLSRVYLTRVLKIYTNHLYIPN